MNKVEFIMRWHNGRWVRYPAASPDHLDVLSADALEEARADARANSIDGTTDEEVDESIRVWLRENWEPDYSDTDLMMDEEMGEQN
jgi:hypothetical protein